MSRVGYRGGTCRRGRAAGRWRAVWVLTVVVAVAVAAGCSSGPPLVRGAITVDPTTNPDLRGRPSPVVVRVYELKSLGAFNGADFFSLFEKEQEVLGGELVGREEFHLSPAETRPYQRQLQPDTKFIGVVAAFRDLEGSLWRQAVPVPAQRRATVTIGLERQAVKLVVK
jgi:type VI secretion system protein VasD